MFEASATDTLPAARGSRGYRNVFGTFLVPSSQTPIALGVASHYCDDCDDDTYPESHFRISAGCYVTTRTRHGYRDQWRDGARVVRWNLYPCHLSECVGYRCDDFHENLCGTCQACENHCDCFYCNSCSEMVSSEEGYCGNCGNCEQCCDCSSCDICNRRTVNLREVDDREVCETCIDYHFGYCDTCEEYYHYDNSSDHDHSGCDCVAPNLRFRFPNGADTLGPDERLTVELPSGAISNEGIDAIVTLLIGARLHATDTEWVLDSWDIRRVVRELDPTWQTKAGNFTKRISKTFYRDLRCKIPANVLSEIGNLASQHTSKQNEFRIELTRDLNQSADAFYHSDSCWFSSGGYAVSKCALKNWGGIAIRTYDSDDSDSDRPNGRAWIQPLDENLKPSGDIDNARGFLVYNGYGELEGYAAVRILAFLTGRTYRKIALELDPQYVNGGHGYLIADEATCKGTESVSFGGNAHEVRA